MQSQACGGGTSDGEPCDWPMRTFASSLLHPEGGCKFYADSQKAYDEARRSALGRKPLTTLQRSAEPILSLLSIPRFIWPGDNERWKSAETRHSPRVFGPDSSRSAGRDSLLNRIPPSRMAKLCELALSPAHRAGFAGAG